MCVCVYRGVRLNSMSGVVCPGLYVRGWAGYVRGWAGYVRGCICPGLYTSSRLFEID